MNRICLSNILLIALIHFSYSQSWQQTKILTQKDAQGTLYQCLGEEGDMFCIMWDNHIFDYVTHIRNGCAFTSGVWYKKKDTLYFYTIPYFYGYRLPSNFHEYGFPSILDTLTIRQGKKFIATNLSVKRELPSLGLVGETKKRDIPFFLKLKACLTMFTFSPHKIRKSVKLNFEQKKRKGEIKKWNLKTIKEAKLSPYLFTLISAIELN